MKVRFVRLFPILIAVALAAVGCASKTTSSAGSGGGSPAAQSSPSATSSTMGGKSVTVHLSNYKFTPATLHIESGEDVSLTVVNDGTTAHTFTIPGVVDTGAVNPGQSKTVTFTAPSTSTQFFCQFHKALGMVGNIGPAGSGSGGSGSGSSGGGWG